MRDVADLGLIGKRKLDPVKARQVVELVKAGVPKPEIAKRFGGLRV